jgi:lysophospholipase L1-like esterase
MHQSTGSAGYQALWLAISTACASVACGSSGTSHQGAVGGDGGGGAVTGNDGAGGGTEPCLAKPSEVVAVGDSYVAAPVMLVPKVEQLAIADGALMQGDMYRDYSIPGATIGSTQSPGTIPPQWTRAKQADSDIKFVIMDGGGNDILAVATTCLGAGASMNPTCTGIVQQVSDVITQMMSDMKAVGVRDVVYVLYPHVPAGGAELTDYSVSQAQQLCASGSTDTFKCHLVDTRMAFQGHPEYFSGDPIHPNAMGAQVIAQLVWDTMKTNCIAQPASAHCCMP